MSVLYRPDKSNIVVDALSRLSMSNVVYVEECKKELVHDVHRLARLCVQLVDYKESGVVVQNGSESSFVSVVKVKQSLDPILVELKELEREIVCFDISMLFGAKKMYRDLQEIYWWNEMKNDIAKFVAKCPNCQQVKVEHKKSRGVLKKEKKDGKFNKEEEEKCEAPRLEEKERGWEWGFEEEERGGASGGQGREGWIGCEEDEGAGSGTGVGGTKGWGCSSSNGSAARGRDKGRNREEVGDDGEQHPSGVKLGQGLDQGKQPYLIPKAC
ncbi:hypothetical protein MTR67_035722 [Solanum verrucosum]|uniref:Integrase zinc-binding domain-containing protein n=1 Tax=Solanum verrucosum TaxID=315347 RepID=A0AAF0UAE7_SOLVR|nr:hypothetical protein MTR67_035722 [Solanum verrucosum]